MAITVSHAKTNNITDWTQTDLDAQIALGNFPPGTVLADIVLPSDWNDNHSILGTKSDFDAACTDGNFLYSGDNISELTNDAGYITSQGNAFTTIAVSGQSDVVADSTTDTLTLVAGSNITLTTNATTDEITIAASGGGGTPGGSSGQLQYNNAGSFAGVADITYDGTDIIVSSDNNTHMLFVDGSDDVIGINTSTPNSAASMHILAPTTGTSYRALLVEGSSTTNAGITIKDNSTNYATIGISNGKLVMRQGQFVSSGTPYIQFSTSGHGASIHASASTNLYGQGNINAEVPSAASYPAFQALMAGTPSGTEKAFSVVSQVGGAGGFYNSRFTVDYTGLTNIYPLTASTKGLVIKGAASQTANLQEWQNSAGTALAYVEADGTIRAKNNAGLGFKIGTTNSGMENSGGILRLVDANNGAVLRLPGYLSGLGYGQVQLLSLSSSRVMLNVQGASGQTANLQEWRNNAGTALSYVDASGIANFPQYCDESGADAFTAAEITALKSGSMEAPLGGAVADGTYIMHTYAVFAFTINSINGLKHTSGTSTLAVKINGTDVTGLSALSVSSTPQNATATAANSVAIGDQITFVVSSGSSPVDLFSTLSITRT